MDSGGRRRFSLVEYGAPIDLSGPIAAAAQIDKSAARHLLLAGGERAAKSLGFSYNPISVDTSGARAEGFSGLIRLGPSLELEIAPKFLGVDDTDSRWREDFFYIATLSKHGRLLATERMASSGNSPRDLATLVARSMSTMYWDNQRRPLRSYRRTKETGFFLEGEPDPVDLCFPGPDGFEQEVLRFDRRNIYNATILAAARELIPEVPDPLALTGLERIARGLSPQFPVTRPTMRRLPGRSRGWQPLFDLSVDVLKGFGLDYRQGAASSPGYLVDTWRAWEDLLTIAARLGFGASLVHAQKSYRLGQRQRHHGREKQSDLNVVPDMTVEANGSCPRFLLDAKYKGHIEKSLPRIMEPDIYEAVAFSKAAKCQLVVLAYPAIPMQGKEVNPLGNAFVLESLEIADTRILAVQVEVRGISKIGGLREFSDCLAKSISEIVIRDSAARKLD